MKSTSTKNQELCFKHTVSIFQPEIWAILKHIEAQPKIQSICLLKKNMYIIMKEIIALTRERLYGKYMHNLLVHAPIQYCFVSDDSINTEDEERQFNEIKNIFKGATNNKPGHFIGNIIVRMKCESSAKQKFDYVKSIDNTVRAINSMGNQLVKYRILTIGSLIYKGLQFW